MKKVEEILNELEQEVSGYNYEEEGGYEQEDFDYSKRLLPTPQRVAQRIEQIRTPSKTALEFTHKKTPGEYKREGTIKGFSYFDIILKVGANISGEPGPDIDFLDVVLFDSFQYNFGYTQYNLNSTPALLRKVLLPEDRNNELFYLSITPILTFRKVLLLDRTNRKEVWVDITCPQYPYASLLEYLKTNKIKVNLIRFSISDIAFQDQFNQPIIFTESTAFGLQKTNQLTPSTYITPADFRQNFVEIPANFVLKNNLGLKLNVMVRNPQNGLYNATYTLSFFISEQIGI